MCILLASQNIRDCIIREIVIFTSVFVFCYKQVLVHRVFILNMVSIYSSFVLFLYSGHKYYLGFYI